MQRLSKEEPSSFKSRRSLVGGTCFSHSPNELKNARGGAEKPAAVITLFLAFS